MKDKNKKQDKTNMIVMGTIVAIIIIGFIFSHPLPTRISSDKDFIEIGNVKTSFDNDMVLLKTYTEYSEYVDSDKLKEEDFKDHNYVLLSINYDPCSESDITPTEHYITNQTLHMIVKYKARCGGCAPDSIYYLVEIDKNEEVNKVDIAYRAINDPHCDPGMSYKPLIYLYPEEKMNVSVKVGYPKRLTVSYPEYNDGWDVIAEPDGNIIDINGRNYYGLYWEGKNNFSSNFKDGFVVNKKDLVPFLEEKLFILGLSEREANEFIVYWLPKLQENDYNLIRFESINSINKQMPLEINPEPDTIIRVMMKYKPLNKKIKIKEQELTTPIREGFTVVEWGGTISK